MNNLNTLAVIGTVGRDKSRPLTKNHFEFMTDVLSQHIDSLYRDYKDIEKDGITLYSGGAAWSDHSAVDYFLKNPKKCKLVLYLPCHIIETIENGKKVYRFEDNGSYGAGNPGRTSNGYHSYFSKQIGRDSILDIIRAKELGAILDNSEFGYKNRDLCISKANYIIAFTGAVGPKPLGGGTKYTWEHAKTLNKLHITLPESFSKINLK